MNLRYVPRSSNVPMPERKMVDLILSSARVDSFPPMTTCSYRHAEFAGQSPKPDPRQLRHFADCVMRAGLDETVGRGERAISKNCHPRRDACNDACGRVL